MNVATSLSGMVTIFVYIFLVFERLNLNNQTNIWLAILFTGVQFPMAMTAHRVTGMLGKRKMIIYSFLLMTVMLILLPVLIHINNKVTNIMAACVQFLFQYFFWAASVVVDPLPHTYLPEDQQVVTTAIGSFLNWATAAALAFLYPIISLKIGFWTFLINAFFTFSTTIFAYFNFLESGSHSQDNVIRRYASINSETGSRNSLFVDVRKSNFNK